MQSHLFFLWQHIILYYAEGKYSFNHLFVCLICTFVDEARKGGRKDCNKFDTTKRKLKNGLCTFLRV